MSRTQRLGLLAAAVVVAVVAFVIAKPGDDDGGSGAPAPAAQNAAGEQETPEETPTATAPSAPEPPAAVRSIRLRDLAPVGGVKEIRAVRGETVVLAVRSDRQDELHVHGYEIFRDVAPGKVARIRFEAKIEGVFEIESHEAEHGGQDPLVAKLVVEPS